MRHPFRSSLCLLALFSSACGSTTGNDGNPGSGTDALNTDPATGEAVPGEANSKPEPGEGCGGGASEDPSASPIEDCFGEVFAHCESNEIDAIDCKELAVEKCQGWGEPPAPPTDCYGEVFEACADRGIDEVDCKEFVIAQCEPEPSTEPYDPGADCYAEVQRLCDEGRIDPTECKDLAFQKCEPQPEDPGGGSDPYTDCLKTGRDPVACKEALAGGSGTF